MSSIQTLPKVDQVTASSVRASSSRHLGPIRHGHRGP